MQWDDHDICDGWGSLSRAATYSPVGQTIFDVAREMALGFQHAARDGDLPGRFVDPKGLHLGWQVERPGLRLLAPDLRSERTRRRIMGEGGWAMMEAARDDPFHGRTLLVSSVPLLGPRLSLLKGVMRRVIGWAVSNRMERDLAIRALKMAIAFRASPKGCIFHSDKGSRYCSHDDQKILRQHCCKVSMSGKGNCYDNAAPSRQHALHAPAGQWSRRSSKPPRPS